MGHLPGTAPVGTPACNPARSSAPPPPRSPPRRPAACPPRPAAAPQVLALLAGKLLALPRELFTQETYIQLYQAKMSLSHQVRRLRVQGGCRLGWPWPW